MMGGEIEQGVGQVIPLTVHTLGFVHLGRLAAD
jgi:hypothetical protein